MDYQEKQERFRKELLDLIETHQEHLPPYEVSYELINSGVSIALYCAPNELVGVKTIMACVQSGIEDYEKTHS